MKILLAFLLVAGAAVGLGAYCAKRDREAGLPAPYFYRPVPRFHPVYKINPQGYPELKWVPEAV